MGPNVTRHAWNLGSKNYTNQLGMPLISADVAVGKPRMYLTYEENWERELKRENPMLLIRIAAVNNNQRYGAQLQNLRSRRKVLTQLRMSTLGVTHRHKTSWTNQLRWQQQQCPPSFFRCRNDVKSKKIEFWIVFMIRLFPSHSPPLLHYHSRWS